MNRHEMIFNIINDECYFTSSHCDHVEIFFLLSRSSIFQKLFNSNKHSNKTLYLSFSKRFLTSFSSTNVQKYQILQRRSVSTFFRVIFSRFTVKDSKKNEQSIEKFLNSDFKYVVEKINKKYSSNKSFKEKRKTKIIREIQKSSLINVSIKRFDIFKKFARRFSRRFKVTISKIENDEQNFDFDISLNVTFIDATIFQSLTKFKKKKKKSKSSH